MNLHLYTSEYQTPVPDTLFRSLLTLLPAPQQQKVLKFRHWEDRHAALLGKLLLRLALQNAGYGSDLSLLQYTPEQKPFLLQGPAFNLSHSGNRVVCLLGDRDPLGIDIECLTPLPFDDFQPQFSEAEWTAIRHSPEPLLAFYRFWTAKESILKADGRGLGIPLRSLDLSGSMIVTLDGTTWSVHELPLFGNYACHYTIAGENPVTVELHELNVNELCLLAEKTLKTLAEKP